ncbi:MAG TPA: hypothetical protein VF787_02825 [Thermoanaerobaculia bacterium]
MSTQSWNVDVDGVTRQIVAESDEQSRRTAIRVDGKMATRPLLFEEGERLFTIGSVAYVLKRTPDGQLDLDLAPQQLQPRPPAVAPPAQRARTMSTSMPTHVTRATPKKRAPIGLIIGVIVLAVVVLGGLKYAGTALTYSRVPWESYTHNDRAFTVDFAGKPKRSTEFISTPAGVLRTVQLKSKYEDHHYVVEFIDLPVVMPPDRVGPLFESILQEMVGTDKVESKWSGGALTFVTEVTPKKDWSEGTMRGKILLGGKRLYIVYGFFPRGETVTSDVTTFLDSLEIG